jgi:hypothetical protein
VQWSINQLISSPRRVSIVVSPVKFYHRIKSPFQVLGAGLACLFLHELGHVVGAYSTGQHITEFVLFSVRPHVSIAGPVTALGEAVTAASGSALVLFSWLLLLLLPRSCGSEELCHAVSGFAYIELLGWTLSSVWPPGGSSPDDAVRFMATSGANMWIVVGVVLLLALAGAVLLYSRTMPQRTVAKTSTVPSPRASTLSATGL